MVTVRKMMLFTAAMPDRSRCWSREGFRAVRARGRARAPAHLVIEEACEKRRQRGKECDAAKREERCEIARHTAPADKQNLR